MHIAPRLAPAATRKDQKRSCAFEPDAERFSHEPTCRHQAMSPRAPKKDIEGRDPDAIRDQIILGRTLRQLRHDAGLTQEGLAHRLRVFPTFIGRLERGERGARWHTVRKVLVALDVTPVEFGAALNAQERKYKD